MSYYTYKLIERTGRTRRGFIDLPFENEQSAWAYLERTGDTVISARLLGGVIGMLITFFNSFMEQSVKREDISEVLSNLAVMLKSGIPAMSAIEDAIIDNENGTISRAGRDMLMRVESGYSFSDAISYYPGLFPPVVQFLCRVGEESGTLDRTLKDAADHIRRMDRIRKDIRSALTYPIMAVVTIFLAMGFWIYWVVPTLVDLFRTMNVELPWLTVVIIDVSDYLINNLEDLVIKLAILLVVLVLIVKRVPAIKRAWHLLILKLPLIKNVAIQFNTAFITEYFGLLISAGVDITRSLTLISETLENLIYREKLEHVRRRLIEGNSLRGGFSEVELFPRFVVRMIGIGEESGSLPEQLHYIAEEYSDRLSRTVNGL
ncbi:MAG: type II secretion system F family protein, partial [Gammaproteobacteria bacterium]|nr:type II secretion system F family protein [Gammaproteobacteria bacterium]